MSTTMPPGDIKRIVTLWTKMHRLIEAIDRVKADIKLNKEVNRDIANAKQSIQTAIDGLSGIASSGLSKYTVSDE